MPAGSKIGKPWDLLVCIPSCSPWADPLPFGFVIHVLSPDISDIPDSVQVAEETFSY